MARRSRRFGTVRLDGGARPATTFKQPSVRLWQAQWKAQRAGQAAPDQEAPRPEMTSARAGGPCAP